MELGMSLEMEFRASIRVIRPLRDIAPPILEECFRLIGFHSNRFIKAAAPPPDINGICGNSSDAMCEDDCVLSFNGEERPETGGDIQKVFQRCTRCGVAIPAGQFSVGLGDAVIVVVFYF
ncbi:hypothetical protein L1887_20468 [Cichorium endivia]|nr:hypothetical protein L1887_20468 [Cichorium endivia]